MAFNEVSVSQVKEVLRLWLHADEGVRVWPSSPAATARPRSAT